MKAIIITNSTNFEPRAELVGRCLKEAGVEVQYIYSDFSHREKKKLHRSEPDHVYVPTIPYHKNLSLRRIRSQMDFAKKTGRLLEAMNFDLLYVMLPANSLAKAAVGAIEQKVALESAVNAGAPDYISKGRRNPKLVFDIIDLWPESLRLGKLAVLPPFTYWKSLRDRYLPQADLVITECDLYRQMLHLDPERSVTMYWAKEESKRDAADWEVSSPASDNHRIRLAYLGAINNIIDIDGIVKVCKDLNDSGRQVHLEIIGDGEGRENFLSALQTAGIGYTYHGTVFDENKKREILTSCDFGLNLMKPGVCVGLTMKSIDYWSYGLPILNNIPGDTWELVEKEEMGFNVDISKQWKKKIITADRKHILNVYRAHFTENTVSDIIKRNILPLCMADLSR